MKYFDPDKFDEYPDEPDDAEYMKLRDRYLGEYGAHNCYDGTPPKLSESEKEHLMIYWKPKRDYDDLDVALGLIRREELDPVVNFITEAKPITHPFAVEFNWRWQTTTNANTQNGTRDRIRLGRLETQTQNFRLWGFASWQEFNAHLAYVDKAQVRYYYDQLSTAIALISKHSGDYKFCYWLPKDEQHTRSNWWAISVDTLTETPGRDILIYNAGTLITKNNLALIQKNVLNLKFIQN